MKQYKLSGELIEPNQEITHDLLMWWLTLLSESIRLFTFHPMKKQYQLDFYSMITVYITINGQNVAFKLVSQLPQTNFKCTTITFIMFQ